MADVSNIEDHGQHYIRIHILGPYTASYEDLTPTAAEHLLNELRNAINKARSKQQRNSGGHFMIDKDEIVEAMARAISADHSGDLPEIAWQHTKAHGATARYYSDSRAALDAALPLIGEWLAKECEVWADRAHEDYISHLRRHRKLMGDPFGHAEMAAEAADVCDVSEKEDRAIAARIRVLCTGGKSNDR